MGIFDGVLIASDLDGTLLGENHELSRENRSALEFYMSQGGKFAVATGRSRAGAECLKPWEFSNAPAVLSNGGLIFDYAGDSALFTDMLSPATRAAAKDIAREFPGAGLEVHVAQGKYIINSNPAIASHMAYVRCTGAVVPSLDAVAEGWIKVLFVDEPELVAEIGAWAGERYGDAASLVFSNEYMLEIQNKGTDKGSGVRWLAELLGIDPANVYTAGDAGNDLEMMLAFESFAPENASDEIKAAANHPLPSCDRHAIAAMIAFLKERYGGSQKL